MIWFKRETIQYRVDWKIIFQNWKNLCHKIMTLKVANNCELWHVFLFSLMYFSFVFNICIEIWLDSDFRIVWSICGDSASNMISKISNPKFLIKNKTFSIIPSEPTLMTCHVVYKDIHLIGKMYTTFIAWKISVVEHHKAHLSLPLFPLNSQQSKCFSASPMPLNQKLKSYNQKT